MPLSDNRNTPITYATLSEVFKQVGGYYEMGNEELAGTLLRWELLEEPNRNNAEIVWSFLNWSLTASFLQLMNAFQWLMSALLLQRSSYLPAQTMQQYYYSIFFSYGSFLALHGKGHYTVSIEERRSQDPKAIRKEVWLDEGPPPRIEIKEKRWGGEHEVRANWFYEVFKSWDQKDVYPAVLMFEEDRKFHTGFRNLFTYALSEMAEELHHDDSSEPVSNDILLRLWNGEAELVDYFPEEFWLLEHLRAPLDLHSKLIESFGSGSPLTSMQEYIVNSLLSRHDNDGLADLLDEILKPIIAGV